LRYYIVIFTIFGREMDLPARWFCRLGGGIRYTLYKNNYTLSRSPRLIIIN
jgi:hypothetical protein